MQDYTLAQINNTLNPFDVIGASVTIGTDSICMDHLIGKSGKITKVERVSNPTFFEVTFADGTTKSCMLRDFVSMPMK